MYQCTQEKQLLVPHQLMDKVNRPPLKQAGSIVHRPGSLELLKQPSRIGDSLFYPDGRIEKGQA
jgi:hypothetical protein